MTFQRIIAFIILGVFFCWFVFIVVAPKRPFHYPDGFDYVQMALNLAHKKDFLSSQVAVHHAYWFSRHGVDLHNVSTVPMLYRFPLPVIMEAAFIRLGFSPYNSALMYATLGCLFSGLTLFWIVLRFSDSGGAALALVSAFLLSENTLGFAITGLTESWATFFFLLLLLVLTSPITLLVRTILGALLCGLAFLNRSPSVFIMYPTLFCGILMSRSQIKISIKNSFKFIFISIVIFIMLIFPWLYHNYIITGNWFFNFTNAINLLSGLEKPKSYAMFYSMSTLDFISSNFSCIIQKILSNMIFGVINLRNFLSISKIVLLPFLLGLCIVIYKNLKLLSDVNLPWFRMVVILWGSACLFNLVGHSFGIHDNRHYASLWPLVLVLTFAGNYFLLQYISKLFSFSRSRVSNHTIKSLSGIMTAILYLALNPPLFHPVKAPMLFRPWETVQAVRECKALLCETKTNGAIISDVSDVFAVELHGCNLLMCGYQFDTSLLESSSLKEWDKFVDVKAIFISRKGWEHMSQEDKKILGEKEKAYPRIINFADGSRLYLK
jgi:hypothetical protein